MTTMLHVGSLLTTKALSHYGIIKDRERLYNSHNGRTVVDRLLGVAISGSFSGRDSITVMCPMGQTCQ